MVSRPRNYERAKIIRETLWIGAKKKEIDEMVVGRRIESVQRRPEVSSYVELDQAIDRMYPCKVNLVKWL